MKNRRSLDYDGLDGILQPTDLVKAKPVWYKYAGTFALIAVLLISLFLAQNPAPTPSINAERTSSAPADSKTSKQPQTLVSDQSSETRPITEPESLAESTGNPESLPIIETQDVQNQSNSGPASAATGNDMPVKPVSESLFTVYFKFASKKPNLLTTTETDNLVNFAKSCPNLIKLTGHTCNLGTDASNDKLGLARAEAVKELLISHDIASQRIVIASEGMNSPAATNDTKAGQALNRRTELSCLDH